MAKDSPDDQAGVRTDDILIKLDDQLLLSPAQLQTLVRHKKEGDSVTLTLMLQGKEQKLAITIAKTQAGTPDPRREGMLQRWRGRLPENWSWPKEFTLPKGEMPKIEFDKLIPRIAVKPGESGKFFNYRIQTSQENAIPCTIKKGLCAHTEGLRQTFPRHRQIRQDAL